jgi:hypothetical protein
MAAQTLTAAGELDLRVRDAEISPSRAPVWPV